MAGYYIGNKFKIVCGGNKIKKGLYGGNVIYSGANPVTYHVDTGIVYTEEVDEGDNVLSPKTFTPSKSGWTFVGWRTDKTASSGVLSDTVMGDSAMTLYAVFSQSVVVTYYNGTTTASTTSKSKYYNNGNLLNPSFTLTQSTLSGWTPRGWSTGTAGNSNITYENATAFTIDSNVIIYGMYQQTITLSYNGNGSTSGSVSEQTNTRYYNSNGTTINPIFTLSANGFAKTDYNFSKWAMSSASGAQYVVGASVTLTANTTFYAIWTVVANKVIYTATNINGTVLRNTTESYKDTSHVLSITNPLIIGSSDNSTPNDEGDDFKSSKSMTLILNFGVFKRAVVYFYMADDNTYEGNRTSGVYVGGQYYGTQPGLTDWWSGAKEMINNVEHSISITTNSLTVTVEASTNDCRNSDCATGFAISKIVLYP